MDYWLWPVFALVAAAYASVGFGGGSSYLALLQLAGLPFLPLRATALLCNLTVVSGGSWLYFRAGHLRPRRVGPLVLASVPMAYLGGWLPVAASTFYTLLGISLMTAAALMWYRPARPQIGPGTKAVHPIISMGLGGAIGLLSGVVGIGGGVFLAPVLHLLRWDTPVRIAATASLFILVNSAAGLAGQLANPELHLDGLRTLGLVLAVFIGGQIGSRLSTRCLSPRWIKRLTAVLIFFVGWRVLGGWPF